MAMVEESIVPEPAIKATLLPEAGFEAGISNGQPASEEEGSSTSARAASNGAEAQQSDIAVVEAAQPSASHEAEVQSSEQGDGSQQSQ